MRLCAMMHLALEQLVDALETDPDKPVGSPKGGPS
jgi:hypothetical protein